MTFALTSIPSVANCLICHDPLSDGPFITHITEHLDPLTQERVRHVFHRICVQPWLMTHGNCPTCRAGVRTTIDFSFLPMSLNVHEGRVLAAAHAGEPAALEQLLNESPISELIRGQAAATAARNGHYDALQLLLQSGPISEFDRLLAITMATEFNRLPSVQLLLVNATLSQENRGIAVRGAARLARFDIAQVLLAHGPIPDVYRYRSLADAAANQQHAIMKEILKTASLRFSIQCYAAAFRYMPLTSKVSHIAPTVVCGVVVGVGLVLVEHGFKTATYGLAILRYGGYL
jgi:hypothetical protein